jgi:hypothetical protein
MAPPAARSLTPMPTSDEVLNWVRSRVIAFAKRRESAG